MQIGLPRSHLATVDELEIAIDLPASWHRRRWVLPRVYVAEGSFNLEVDETHGANVAGLFGEKKPRRDVTLAAQVDLVVLQGIAFTVFAAAQQLELVGNLHANDASAADAEAIVANGAGTFRGRNVTIEAGLGGIEAWYQHAGPIALRIDAVMDNTSLTLDGHINQPRLVRDYRIQATITGPDPAILGPLLSLPIPHLPPYNVTAIVHDPAAQVLATDYLVGDIGDSDISGNLVFDLSAGRPQVSGELKSSHLDLDDIAGIVGAAPDSGPGETASARQSEIDERNEARATVIPDRELDLTVLQRANIDVHYRATRIETPHLPLENVDAKIVIADGNLALQPVELSLGGGQLKSRLELQQSGALNLAASMHHVSLRAILHDLEITDEAAGYLTGFADIASRGRSAAEWLGTMNGGIKVFTQGGQLDSVLVELLGLDAGEALVAHLADSERVALRCAIAEAAAADGVIEFERLLLDTSDTIIRGGGRLSLKTEQYEIQFDSEAKDVSLLSGDAPVYLTGTLKHPDVKLDWGETLLSFLTPIEFGNGSDIDCDALLRTASKR